MESTFSGLDKGPFAGQHLTTDMLEGMGRDLCRTILVQQNLFVPTELQKLPEFQRPAVLPKKTFSAEQNSAGDP